MEIVPLTTAGLDLDLSGRCSKAGSLRVAGLHREHARGKHHLVASLSVRPSFDGPFFLRKPQKDRRSALGQIFHGAAPDHPVQGAVFGITGHTRVELNRGLCAAQARNRRSYYLLPFIQA